MGADFHGILVAAAMPAVGAIFKKKPKKSPLALQARLAIRDAAATSCCGTQ